MRHAFALVLLGALMSGCESGSSEGPRPISFEAAPPPAGTGFVALYAPPVDIGPYPNDIYNPPGQTLGVPEKITSPLAAALNTLDGFSTTAHISAPFNAPIDPATVVPFNPLTTRRVRSRSSRSMRRMACRSSRTCITRRAYRRPRDPAARSSRSCRSCRSRLPRPTLSF